MLKLCDVAKNIVLLVWLTILMLPSLTIFGSTHQWDVAVWLLPSISLLFFALLFFLLGQRYFFIASSPLVLCSILITGADLYRKVNLVELIALSPAFTFEEIETAVSPYAAIVLCVSLMVVAVTVFLYKESSDIHIPRLPRWILFFLCLLAIFSQPTSVLARAWPTIFLGATYSTLADDKQLAMSLFPFALINPRKGHTSWKAHQQSAQEDPEIYVLIVGESVRADRIPGCGGREQVWQKPDNVLLFCDVVSGSSSTHTSVPLLISREIPGNMPSRVSSDSSILKAFEEAGFETFWLAVQEESIAWPDAMHRHFAAASLPDADILSPMLDAALRSPRLKKFIIIHTYNAHFPYTARYHSERAPFPVQKTYVTEMPSLEHITEWWNAYDNAVSESMHFLDIVINRLEQENARTFLLYTPDHGENMLDDERMLFQHALRFPTKWDTTVPMIAWANPGWIGQNKARWEMLAGNQQSQLMHMDVVPTLLGASSIKYEDARKMPVDLTEKKAPQRKRITQKAIQYAVEYDHI